MLWYIHVRGGIYINYLTWLNLLYFQGQYCNLYDTAEHYIDSFEQYANFKWEVNVWLYIYYAILRWPTSVLFHPLITWQDILVWSPFCASHPNLTYIQTIHTWPLIYVCRTTLINRTRLPVGGGSFNSVWWGYKYMFPLDRGSKIHSSWIDVAKMLTIFYWVSVTPLGINNGHLLSSNFQIFLALCKCATKT